MMRAAVHTATINIEIMEITLMKFRFRLERKYFLAIKNGRFNTSVFFFFLVSRRDVQIVDNLVNPCSAFF